jgi:hypothetical protein
MLCRIHIPTRLLAAIDRRAKALKISRGQVIVRALERELTPNTQWSPGFFAELEAPLSEADGMLRAIRKHRRSRQVRNELF